MQFNASSELGWLALRYVARQMTEGERESFEQRLLDDQPAREAVAQAVELAHCVAAIHADEATLDHDALRAALEPASAASQRGWPQVAPTTHWAARRRSLGWTAVAVAAALAISLVLRPGHGPVDRLRSSPNGDVAARQPLGNEQLSAVWANLSESGPKSADPTLTSLTSLTSLTAESADPAEESLADVADREDSGERVEAEIPVWILHGLVGSRTAPPLRNEL